MHRRGANRATASPMRTFLELSRFCCQRDGPYADSVLALQLHARHSLSYWNAAILAEASAPGCGIMLSEDMWHGRDYDGVTVINPFCRSAGVAGDWN